MSIACGASEAAESGSGTLGAGAGAGVDDGVGAVDGVAGPSSRSTGLKAFITVFREDDVMEDMRRSRREVRDVFFSSAVPAPPDSLADAE